MTSDPSNGSFSPASSRPNSAKTFHADASPSSAVVLFALRAGPEPAPRHLPGRQAAPATASTSSFWPAITSTDPRNRCRRWRGSSRSTTGSSAACSSRPTRKTGFIEPGSSNIPGLEALNTADLLVIFLRFQDFPDDRDAAHRRLPRSRRAGGRLPHRDARVSDQAAGREVPEVRLAEQGRATPAASAGRSSARPGSRTTGPITK